MRKSLKILIADDHPLVRDGLINTISKGISNVSLGEASSAAGVLKEIRRQSWDLLILDINMPGRDGLDVLRELKTLQPDLPVIILSMYPEDQYAVRTLKMGASAYLTKETSPRELLTAIQTVIAGQKYLTSSISRILAEEITGKQANPTHEILSNREFQVLKLIASGKNISGIALELSLSVKTISVYRSNILQKLSLKNNAEITNYAFRNNLTD
jgi:two-component system, NarL family, invasion response regulator UvrY